MTNMMSIHPKAKIGRGNIIGNWVTIGENVNIGDNNTIGDCVSITGNTIIGNGNIIGSGSVFGTVSNHILRSYDKKAWAVDLDKAIKIGDGNLLSDGVTIHAPVVSVTYIGDEVNVGTRTHVAHDNYIEDRVVINAHCSFGGYVRILRGANVGANVCIHPRLVIGQYSMLGLGCVVIRHISPGATVVGNPQRYLKPNVIGMKRNRLSQDCIEELCLLLETKQIDLDNSTSETREILIHFSDKKKQEYVRDVATIPLITIEG